jgi:hypothetical protein
MLEESQRDALADWLVGLGPLVTTGDTYALQYFLLVLVNLYGPTSVRLHEAWSLKRALDADPTGRERRLAELVRGGNMILIGGPSGNPITGDLLRTLGAMSLFPDSPHSDFRIRKWGSPCSLDESGKPILDDNNHFSPRLAQGDTTDEDCGLLLLGKNPWGKGTSAFLSAMGSASWGTQACAALASSAVGAAEVTDATVEFDELIGDAPWLRGIGYVKVWPKCRPEAKCPGRLPQLTVPECEFQMVYPSEGKRHANPSAILRANEILRREQHGPNVEIGFRPAVLLLGVFCWCIASALLMFALLMPQSGWGPVSAAITFGAVGIGLFVRSLGVGRWQGQRLATHANLGAIGSHDNAAR